MKHRYVGIILLFLVILIAMPIISASDDANFADNNESIVEEYNSSLNIIDNIEESDNQLNHDYMDDYSENMENINQSSVFVTRSGHTIVINNLIKYYGGSQRFNVTIYYNNNYAPGIDVDFTINGVTYSRTTNAFGQALLAINLSPGVYPVITDINELSLTFQNTATVLSTIVGFDIVKYYKNGTQYYATFYDTSGNLLTNTNITFNINGIIYTRTTNSSGIAKLNINLDPGNYIITASNPVSGQLYSNNITVLTTILTSDLTMNYGDGSKFKAKLLNGQGNPYSGQTVTFNIGGIFYYSVTDSNGIASLTITLPRGSYIITSSHNGLSIPNNIIIN